MTAETREAFRREIRRPHGFVVVTGPTGSGKTTTLYAALSDVDAKAQNICTIEDPVEAPIPAVTQVQVNARAGLTFPAALRAMLRQDPDVIMIGELRDGETARIAGSAALSGQLVLATLHTGDAIGAVARLTDLGVERSVVAAGLSAIVAQRLVRTLCTQCRREQTSAQGRHWTAAGCEACAGSGYRGRTGIYELIVIDETSRDAIAVGLPQRALRELVRTTMPHTLGSECLRRVQTGETSVDEVRRVLGWNTGQ